MRPDGVDGWRPARQNVAPLDAASPELAATPLSGGSASAQQEPVSPQSNVSAPAESSVEPQTESGSSPISVHFRSPELNRRITPESASETGGSKSVASEFDGIAPDVDQRNLPVPAPAPKFGGSIATAEGPSGKNSPDGQPETPPAAVTVPDTSAADDSSATDDTEFAKDGIDDGSAATEPTSAADGVPDDSGSDGSHDNSNVEPAEAAPPTVNPLPPLTRQLTNLRSRVRSVLTGYYRKALNSREHDPWEVMHGMLAYEVQSRIRQGGPRGELITSVGWLCYNKPCKGQTLMHVTRDGELRAKYGVGLQGHLGQLLAMLAQCHVSADYPIRVGKNEFAIRDLIES
jgi:hypothetical protein